jgi:cell division protein FtsZ
VDFIVCNTDSQALQSSSVPNKIQLGVNLTEGLGAGANPDVGQQSALKASLKSKDVGSKYQDGFITAGMGGGTGTGAAPVIAQLAKEREILTGVL